MELRHLRYFVVVAEEQNVTRAAARLHVSQPPLSRQIRDLEDELGVPLFRRTAKSLALTEAGKIFLIEARAVLLRAEKAVQTVRTVAAGNRGLLKVGYAPSLTVEILPRTLVAFEQECPGVRIALHDLSTNDCLQKLSCQKIDLALIAEPPRSLTRGFIFQKIKSFPLFCAVSSSHPFAKRKSISLAQLKNERFIVYTRDDYPEYYDWLRELVAPYAYEPSASEEYDSATGLIAAVEAGRGISIVTSTMKSLASSRLKLLPITPKVPPLSMGVIAAASSTEFTQKFISIAKRIASH